MKGTPITFKYQHPLNAALGRAVLVLLIVCVLPDRQPTGVRG